MGDVAWLPSHHMSASSPSPAHDDGNHAVMVEGGQFVEVGLSHPPAF